MKEINMRLIKTDRGEIIKPDDGAKPELFAGRVNNGYWLFGWRWNKNEGRFNKQCVQYLFNSFEWVEAEESELPTTKPLDIDK